VLFLIIRCFLKAIPWRTAEMRFTERLVFSCTELCSKRIACAALVGVYTHEDVAVPRANMKAKICVTDTLRPGKY